MPEGQVRHTGPGAPRSPETGAVSATREQLRQCCEGAQWAHQATARAYRVGGNELGTAHEEFAEEDEQNTW